MPTAVVIGGSGLIGRAVVRTLLRDGWDVTIAARNAENIPIDLVPHTRFKQLDRQGSPSISDTLRGGADLLVDCVCFTQEDAKLISPHSADMGSTVMLSSKAVYVDASGRHINSATKPEFNGPIVESNETMRPGNGYFDSPEGYGSNKVAAEIELLTNGTRVSVLRASKVHGEGARPPREWAFVKRVFDAREAVFLRNDGDSIDHTSAAVNIAALVATCARRPGTRVLNAADPDSPTVRDISRVVASYFRHAWEEIVVDPTDESSLGITPWDTPAPIVLDTTAATNLGYEPVGTYAETVVEELAWLADVGRGKSMEFAEASFVNRFLSYELEDAYLRRR